MISCKIKNIYVICRIKKTGSIKFHISDTILSCDNKSRSIKNWSFRILDHRIQIRISRETNLEQKIWCVIPWFRMECYPLVVSLEMSIMLHFYSLIFCVLNLITGNIFTKILKNFTTRCFDSLFVFGGSENYVL